MYMKVRFLMVGVLLITLSCTALQILLQVQDTGEPTSTEDPCIAIIEAGMQPQGNKEPVATEDPALESCLEALAPTDMDAVGSTTIVAGPDDIYIPITINHSNSFADAGRVWVIWHDPSTGELTASLAAYNTRISYYNMGLDIKIPNNVVNIGIRIETRQDRSSGNWQFNSSCAFAFAKPPQGFSITVDDNNLCMGQIDSP